MKITALKRFASGVTLLALMGSANAFAQQSNKPNVVFILADNVGYGDLGSYGGGELRGAPTPRLDALAQEGLRLTQFLVEPACTPSRAALMTGQYSVRNGLSLIDAQGNAVKRAHGAIARVDIADGELKRQGKPSALRRSARWKPACPRR